MQRVTYQNFQLGFLLLILQGVFAQKTTDERETLDYGQIYSHALDANVKDIFPLLEVDSEQLSEEDALFIENFNKRFKFEEDRSEYLKNKKSRIHDLQLIVREYWRKALLEPKNNFDDILAKEATAFLEKEYAAIKNRNIHRDSLGRLVSEYIESKGYHTTKEMGKTGRIFDLLVWESQRDSLYSFDLKNEEIQVKVVFMNDFVTLGWEEYATFGKRYPGGWATNNAIYCVEEAYDLESEKFKISYLAHEGRHVADKKKYPNLKGPDLEYRAKLSELSLAQKRVYNLLEAFTANANKNSKNPHPLANYCVIRDLSRLYFKLDFQKDVKSWKSVPPEKINRMANKLLKKNTRELQKRGASVERIIRAK
ncbi:hypothetical protein [Flagellimonas meridianipacifica]|uniref:Uncharacterized protein n=1 Tax=Flagellimonas meridianipacifica TaxID=1080225 RepID=A0A2T0MCF9_9FLAO|nr:hypothetical protein [Allomuricauda pacifica]PRX55132.1 hypothetical protein CLV81_3538 [Allomuricauda pacifica]